MLLTCGRRISTRKVLLRQQKPKRNIAIIVLWLGDKNQVTNKVNVLSQVFLCDI